MKVRKSASVNAVPEIANLISGLQSDNYFKLKIEKALDKLKENAIAGKQIEKNRIPSFYINRYHVTNIFVLRLDNSRRLIYTLISDKNGVTANIVDLFLDHKSYESRFGY